VAGLLMLVIFSQLGQVPGGYILYGVLAVLIIGWALRPNFVHLREGTERKIGVTEKNIKHI
jgi:hypothetical protein